MPAVGGSLLAAERSNRERAEVRPTPQPPRLLLVVSGAVVVAGTAMVLVGALRTGVSWDEPYHVMRLRNFLDSGWYAVDWSVEDGGTGAGGSNTLVYGPVTMLLLHGLAVLVGVEGWGTVATTPEAYAVRHLGVAAIGLAGTAAAAATTRLLLGSWRWALVTAAALLALPLWAGHLMFNVKDVPVGTGYAVLTLALVAVVRPPAAASVRPRLHRTLRVAGVAAGTVLMVGTRPGMTPAVVVGAGVVGLGLLVRRAAGPRHRSSDRTDGVAPLAELLTGLGVAAAVLVALYPGVYADPTRLLGSAEQSAEFREGEVTPLYVPFHLAAQFPLLLQAVFVLGLVAAAGAVLRWRGDVDRAVRTAVVLAHVAAFPVAAVLTGAHLYNGLRQLLFIAPAWAVLVALGLHRLTTWATEHGRGRAAAGVAAVALVAPVVGQATLFPYQYTWWNAAVDATGVRLHSDYWRTSVPELLPAVPTDGQVVCSPTRYTADGDPAGSVGARGVPATELLAGRFSGDSSVDCRTDEIGPLATWWTAQGRPLDDTLPLGEFYVVVDRDHPVPANCTELAAVDRWRNGRDVTMTYLARCRLAPPVLDRTVVFSRLPSRPMAPALWAFAAEGWVQRDGPSGITADGGTASLALTTPAGCDPCRLVLDGAAPADLAAVVDGVPVPVTVTDDAASVDLPPGTTATRVTLRRPSGTPLGVRVESVRVVPTGTGQETP